MAPLCSCGKVHENQIEKILISSTLQHELNLDLEAFEDDQVLIVTDEPVSVVYAPILSSLRRFQQLIFKRSEPLVPDETAVGEILLAVTSDTALILAFGSGSINDLCRYVSYRLKLPYWVVMSAPSMDGYASTASPIITRGFKHTFYCHIAKRLYSDPAVLKNAPLSMIYAGVGDLIGKITALMDWQLSHILSKEYICYEIIDDLYFRIDRLLSDLASSSDPSVYDDNIKELSVSINDHLIQSGIYMSYVGNSRPASGSEHLVSHCLEMKGLANHEAIDFHGLKVGMATPLILKLYAHIKQHLADLVAFYHLTDSDVHALSLMIDKGLGYQPMIQDFQAHIEKIMRSYSSEELIDALKQGPSIRDRYTVLTVFKELNWFDRLSEII